MGKKRIIKKGGEVTTEDAHIQAAKGKAVALKRKIGKGIVHIRSTYNNTLITLANEEGDALFQSSSGALGFRGSKKGTPYAASRAAEVTSIFAEQMGLKDIDIRVNGIGAGRESAIRTFVQHGFSVNSIKDMTPIPHGTPRLPKPRRV